MDVSSQCSNTIIYVSAPHYLYSLYIYISISLMLWMKEPWELWGCHGACLSNTGNCVHAEIKPPLVKDRKKKTQGLFSNCNEAAAFILNWELWVQKKKTKTKAPLPTRYRTAVDKCWENSQVQTSSSLHTMHTFSPMCVCVCVLFMCFYVFPLVITGAFSNVGASGDRKRRQTQFDVVEFSPTRELKKEKRKGKRSHKKQKQP